MNTLLSALFAALCLHVAVGDSVGRVRGVVTGLVSVEMEMSETEGQLFVSITGPSDRWFGVGFNNTATGIDAMKDTYAVIIIPSDNNVADVQEWILGDMGDTSVQKQLSTSITDITKATIGTTITVTFARSLIGATPDHKNFTPSLEDMPVIQATGSTQGAKTFGPHNNNADAYSMNFMSVTRGRVDITGIIDVSIDFFDGSASGTADTVFVELFGPAATDFSVLFDKESIQGVNVTANGIVTEVYDGAPVPTIIRNVKVQTIDDIQTVTYERTATGPSKEYHSFSVSDVMFGYTLVIDRNVSVDGVAKVQGVHQTSGYGHDTASNVGVELQMSEQSNEMTITLTGHSADSTYFAVGFGASSMASEPWTLIVMGTDVGEYHTYQDSTSGVTPVPAANTTTGIKVLSSSVTNGIQTIKISRPTKNVIHNDDSFDFGVGTRSLDIIASRGPVANGKVQYHTARGTARVTLYPLLRYSGNANYTTSNGNVSLSVLIDENTNNVTIEMKGPADRWFGVGFGGGAMTDTYSIVVTSQDVVEERVLGTHTPGTKLDSSLTVVSDITSSNTRVVTVVRPVTAGGEYFDFRIQTHTPAGGFMTIAAIGEAGSFAYHGTGFVPEYFVPISPDGQPAPPAPTPSPLPPTNPPTGAPKTVAPSPSSGCIPSDVIIDTGAPVPVTYDCMMYLTDMMSFHWKFEERSNVSHFAVQNAAPGWVGVAVAQHCDFMVPGKGVIGTSDSQDTYLIQEKSGPNAVIVDPTQIVANMSGTLQNGTTTIRWSKKVSDDPVINPNAATCFNYATHESTALGYHGPGPAARGSFKVNLATGHAVTSSSGLKGKRITHGVLMIAAWAWFIPLGILLKRYGKPIFQMGISQFYGHIALMMLGVILTISSYILATSSGFGGGKYSHGTIGTAVLIMACANPVVGVCGYVFVRDPKHPQRWIFNMTHWIIGRGVYVLATVQCFFGIATIHSIEGVSRVPYMIAVILGLAASVFTFVVCELVRLKRTRIENDIQKTIPTSNLLE